MAISQGSFDPIAVDDVQISRAVHGDGIGELNPLKEEATAVGTQLLEAHCQIVLAARSAM